MHSIRVLYEHFLKSSGVCTDNRKADENLIFFALKGEHFDGNRFANSALNEGCKMAIVDDPEVVLDDRYFLVENSLKTLQQLAKHHREQLRIPVIGITGSNGKTTTKELMHAVLSSKYKTLATQGNLNNHIGVPLSILKIRDEEIAIIEMGANHPGEIDFLCRISQPGYGMITNIGKAHLEGFGSLEGIKKAKSELYNYLNEKRGTIFINGSNEILEELSRTNNNLRKIYYINGSSPLCDGFIINSSEKLKLGIKFLRENIIMEADLNLTGAYNMENVLAAACVGAFFNITPEEIIKSLESYKSTFNRSQFIATKRNLVISDAYNANPTSMREALENFKSMKSDNKILILGDMLELGSYSADEHKRILDEIEKEEFNEVYLIGKEFKQFSKLYNFNFYDSAKELFEHFLAKPVTGCLVLLKASRGIALENLLKVL